MSDYLIEFPEDEVIEVLFDDVIVTGVEPPTGTISITENGNYDVTDYAGANVNVPQGITPTGTINITTNGTHDVTTYAEASVNVPQGVFPSGTYNITENGTFDVTNYANASVNVKKLPDDMDFYLIPLTTDTTSVDIPYDASKRVLSIDIISNWYTVNIDRYTVAKQYLYLYGEDYTTCRKGVFARGYNVGITNWNGNEGSDTTTGIYTVDEINHIITMGTNGNYYYRANNEYIAIIKYLKT